MESVTIRLDGTPIPKGRGRVGRNYQVYTPQKTRSFEAAFKLAAMQAMEGRAPFDCALEFTMKAYMPIPPSWSQRKKDAADAGGIQPTARPDLDNILKAVKDACNSVVYVDDSRIVLIIGAKMYSTKPRTIVTVRPL